MNNSDFSYLRNCAKPKLFLHGSQDQYGAEEKIRTLVKTLLGENQLVVVDGADHFFFGKLDQVDAAILSWISEKHPTLVQR